MTLILQHRFPFAIQTMALAAAVTMVALLNLVAPVAADTLIATASSCSLSDVRGGLNWVGIIDASCSITDVLSLRLYASPYVLGFCAGWGLGRWIDSTFVSPY